MAEEVTGITPGSGVAVGKRKTMTAAIIIAAAARLQQRGESTTPHLRLRAGVRLSGLNGSESAPNKKQNLLNIARMCAKVAKGVSAKVGILGILGILAILAVQKLPSPQKDLPDLVGRPEPPRSLDSPPAHH
jgi:hypothetical protein